ncbi:L-arabinose isomerase [Silvimonas iriomotensis]|uniref:L-arabinose isomerase n=1 Tax=Silvimonas iriomotensis TaxID=449662 RepID=A0ABQ2P4R2_9NEIS|nr:L-arabinose isomerase [Silvimonas iriomotensis]GGP17796.1 L-arabinose isomerase [Silvimonas iriomotensis]
MEFFKELEVWFVVGSQHLYGKKTLAQVAENAERIVKGLNAEANLPVKLVIKDTVTSQEGILQLCRDANYAKNCIGLVTWLHTFSPAKMWINGLAVLEKPMMQLHTQFNSVVPWNSMDMDFMNLNQTAHGGREFGFIGARMRKQYHVVVGHWQDPAVATQLGDWIRVAAAVHDSRNLKVARFGDNMREVAVTEGDKVAAQIRFGYAVHAYGLGDLVKSVEAVTQEELDALITEYEATYTLSDAVKNSGDKRSHLIDAARIELGIKHFLDKGGFHAFTTTFENLYGLTQLPGLAVQRLMQQGYGFGAEGDWKTSALLRAIKVMSAGQPGGASFMEDYTYDFTPGNELVIGAHMLEVCPSIANDEKPLLDVQPLSIGKKADPARLVFSARPGPAINVTLIDMGNRFRLIANDLETVAQPKPLPALPVARAVWKALPDLQTSAAAWIYAGGAHHAVYTQGVTQEQLRLFAEMTGIEYVQIGKHTEIGAFKNELNWNEVFFNFCKQ